MVEGVRGETERRQRDTPWLSPEHKLDRHSEPYGNRLVAAPGWFKAPLLDGLRGRLVEVRMSSGALNLDVPDPTVRQHLKEQGRGAGNTLSPG